MFTFGFASTEKASRSEGKRGGVYLRDTKNDRGGRDIGGENTQFSHPEPLSPDSPSPAALGSIARMDTDSQ